MGYDGHQQQWSGPRSDQALLALLERPRRSWKLERLHWEQNACRRARARTTGLSPPPPVVPRREWAGVPPTLMGQLGWMGGCQRGMDNSWCKALANRKQRCHHLRAEPNSPRLPRPARQRPPHPVCCIHTNNDLRHTAAMARLESRTFSYEIHGSKGWVNCCWGRGPGVPAERGGREGRGF